MSFRPYLRLARIPNVFTSFSNVVAGVALARLGQFASKDLLLVAASGALYCAGMVLNDYYDRGIDGIERPERPIPSGEVPARTAARIGAGLAALGLLLAALHGPAPFVVACALIGAIVLYDRWLKDTPLGPWAMGSCRALNVGLGLSVAAWQTPWLAGLPLCLGVFTLLITRFSRFEVGGAGTAELRKTVLGVALLAATIAPLLAALTFSVGGGVRALVLAALPFSYAIVRGRRLFSPLLRDAKPPTIGRAIGGGILLMPALDSAFVAAAGAPLLAVVTFVLAGPAFLLKRWYYLT